MSTLDKDEVLAQFTAAYKAAFGKAPTIEQKPGWFSVDGSKNMRLAELAELGQSYTSTAKKDTSSNKVAADKPATVKKASPAKKPASAKASKPSASGNGKTAEALWQQRLGSDKQRMPRGYR